ncbi:hypothetical protein ALP64_203787 [Pseudomonas syringae pv. actinidiae]|nr:hypothetical protein ALP64_203787 [Pseudomonas syringae pv. actinidiae]
MASLILLAMNMRKRLFHIDKPMLTTDQSFTEFNAFAVIAGAVFCTECLNTLIRYSFYRRNAHADVITLNFPKGTTGRIFVERQHRDQFHWRVTELITLMLPLGAKDQRAPQVDAHRFVTVIENDVVSLLTDNIPVRQPGIHSKAAPQLATSLYRFDVFMIPVYQFGNQCWLALAGRQFYLGNINPCGAVQLGGQHLVSESIGRRVRFHIPFNAIGRLKQSSWVRTLGARQLVPFISLDDLEFAAPFGPP